MWLVIRIHVTFFALQSWFWEWIPSKSNWADAISRLGVEDSWYQAHTFTVSVAFCPLGVWNLPVPALIRVAEYL